MKNSCFGSKNLEASDLNRNTAIVHDFNQTQTNFYSNISILSPLAVVHPYTMREQIPTKQPGYLSGGSECNYEAPFFSQGYTIMFI